MLGLFAILNSTKAILVTILYDMLRYEKAKKKCISQVKIDTDIG